MIISNFPTNKNRQFDESLLAKQDKLTGQPGQVVGFGADGAAVAAQGWSNPNLLDNWYFGDPVNQRGQTEYTGTAGYFIDRWKRDAGILVALTSEGLELRRNSAGNNGVFQPVERWQGLKQQRLTISALVRGTAGTQGLLGFSGGGNSIYDNWVPLTGDLQLITYTFIVPSTATTLNIIIRAATDDDYANEAVTLKAAKLELGPTQTLAHQDADGNWVLNDPPPNKALELAKCQRYQRAIPIGTILLGYITSGGTTFESPMPDNMRASKPTFLFDGAKAAIRTVNGYSDVASSNNIGSITSVIVNSTGTRIIFEVENKLVIGTNNTPASLTVYESNILIDKNI